MMRPHQMVAIGKIGVGGWRILSGVLTGLGKGPIAEASKKYSAGSHARANYATSSVQGGWHMLRDGVRQFFG